MMVCYSVGPVYALYKVVRENLLDKNTPFELCTWFNSLHSVSYWNNTFQ